MLNKNAKLNPQIFADDIFQAPTRVGYGEGLVVAGEENENVVVLSADLLGSTKADKFAKRFPDRTFDTGVAEQNMATVAAGLGISGKIPFISSYGTFSPGRNWEQIRTTIAYNDSNVKIAGHHTGVSTGYDGATHQATEDIAMMRALPNMKVIVPCDAIEARKAVVAVAKIYGPVYLRFGRENSPTFTSEETPFALGRAEILWHPPSSGKKPECVIIGCGPLLYNALLAARELEKEKIGIAVLNNHSIKPMDERRILGLAEKCGAVVTVEEHQVSGGLGGVVSELLARKLPTPIEFIGLRDTYAESGPPSELIKKYGMGVKDIVKAVKKAIKRK